MSMIKRVLTVLNDRCFCGRQMVLAEYERECPCFKKDKEGKVYFAGDKKTTETGNICPKCFAKNSLGVPAERF